MESIYNLVGKNIESFQKLENNLALLIYFSYLPNECELCTNNKFGAREKALEEWDKADKATLGCKLKRIEELKIFETDNDIMVLSFLTDKRNYIVHNFFTNNTFITNPDIESHKKELLEIYKWNEIINTALIRMLQKINNPYGTIQYSLT